MRTAPTVDAKIDRFNALEYERVGVMMRANLIAVKDADGNGDAFTELTQKVIDKAPKASLILMTDNVDNMKAAAADCGDRKPLLFGADSR